MGTMKRYLLGLIFLVFGAGSLIAQDTIPAEEPEQAPTKSLAKAAFESNYFIADQTVTLPPARTLEFVIQHDFGDIQESSLAETLNHIQYGSFTGKKSINTIKRMPKKRIRSLRVELGAY